MDPRENDQARLALLGRPGELQAVADEVRHVLDIGLLVIMGEDHGLFIAFESLDLGEEVIGNGSAHGAFVLLCPGTSNSVGTASARPRTAGTLLNPRRI